MPPLPTQRSLFGKLQLALLEWIALVEAIVQAERDRLNVGSMGDATELAGNNTPNGTSRSAGSDVTSHAKDQILCAQAPMHVDAVFDTAACRPALQVLVVVVLSVATTRE